MVDNKMEKVVCVQCSKECTYPVGFLTQEGKSKYLCDVCREEVLELRIERKRIGDRKLLLD